MTISDFLCRAKAELRVVSETPELDAELILSHVIQKPKAFLFSRPDFQLSLAQKKQGGVLLQRRLMGESIALLFEQKEFYGLDFFINSSVLVPRPETEHMVETLIPLFDGGGTLLDVGTGSGCIAITVAKLSHVDTVIALDISEQALLVAQENAKRHSQHAITFLKSDLFGVFSESSFQNVAHPFVVAANLPYVPEQERHPSTKCEPDIALYSGADGLCLYRKFFQELQKIPFDICFFEFHPPQKNELEHIIQSHFPDVESEFFQDYSGVWRMGKLEKESFKDSKMQKYK